MKRHSEELHRLLFFGMTTFRRRNLTREYLIT